MIEIKGKIDMAHGLGKGEVESSILSCSTSIINAVRYF
jgi:hypothetical protein